MSFGFAINQVVTSFLAIKKINNTLIQVSLVPALFGKISLFDVRFYSHIWFSIHQMCLLFMQKVSKNNSSRIVWYAETIIVRMNQSSEKLV